MVYLDNAATSYPKAPGVASAWQITSKRSARPSTARPTPPRRKQAGDAQLRERLCHLFNHPDPTHAVLTPGATAGLNMVIKGLLRPGDHCLVSSMEHNAVMRPLVQLEREASSLSASPATRRAACASKPCPA